MKRFNGNFEDIKKLQQIGIFNNWFFEFSELIDIWEKHSDDQSAQWLGIENYTYDELWNILERNIL